MRRLSLSLARSPCDLGPLPWTTGHVRVDWLLQKGCLTPWGSRSRGLDTLFDSDPCNLSLAVEADGRVNIQHSFHPVITSQALKDGDTNNQAPGCMFGFVPPVGSLGLLKASFSVPGEVRARVSNAMKLGQHPWIRIDDARPFVPSLGVPRSCAVHVIREC